METRDPYIDSFTKPATKVSFHLMERTSDAEWNESNDPIYEETGLFERADDAFKALFTKVDGKLRIGYVVRRVTLEEIVCI
jgi:hypothetical protein